MIKTEILVVGGGPAGATAARYLAAGGVETLLIQRNLSFRKPCGGGIRLDAFREFELDESVVYKTVRTIELGFKKERIAVDIARNPIGIVDRVEFDGMLRKLAEQNGVKVMEASFVHLEKKENLFHTTIKTESGYETVTSRHVVAADGVHSKVRKIWRGETVSAIMTRYCDIDLAQKSERCSFFFGADVAPKEYAWAFPKRGGADIGTIGEDDRYLSALKHTLGIEQNAKTKGYPIPRFENTVFYDRGVFFVGDSASQVLPFTYEGIYYAMSSAKLLAETIVQEAQPQEYERRWKRRYEKKFTTLLRLQRIFLSNDLTVFIMMKMFRSKEVQRKMVALWLGEYLPQIDAAFFFRVLKRLFVA